MYCVLCILWCILWASGPEINVIISSYHIPPKVANTATALSIVCKPPNRGCTRLNTPGVAYVITYTL